MEKKIENSIIRQKKTNINEIVELVEPDNLLSTSKLLISDIDNNLNLKENIEANHTQKENIISNINELNNIIDDIDSDQFSRCINEKLKYLQEHISKDELKQFFKLNKFWKCDNCDIRNQIFMCEWCKNNCHDKIFKNHKCIKEEIYIEGRKINTNKNTNEIKSFSKSFSRSLTQNLSKEIIKITTLNPDKIDKYQNQLSNLIEKNNSELLKRTETFRRKSKDFPNIIIPYCSCGLIEHKIESIEKIKNIKNTDDDIIEELRLKYKNRTNNKIKFIINELLNIIKDKDTKSCLVAKLRFIDEKIQEEIININENNLIFYLINEILSKIFIDLIEKNNKSGLFYCTKIIFIFLNTLIPNIENNNNIIKSLSIFKELHQTDEIIPNVFLESNSMLQFRNKIYEYSCDFQIKKLEIEKNYRNILSYLLGMKFEAKNSPFISFIFNKFLPFNIIEDYYTNYDLSNIQKLKEENINSYELILGTYKCGLVINFLLEGNLENSLLENYKNTIKMILKYLLIETKNLSSLYYLISNEAYFIEDKKDILDALSQVSYMSDYSWTNYRSNIFMNKSIDNQSIEELDLHLDQVLDIIIKEIKNRINNKDFIKDTEKDLYFEFQNLDIYYLIINWLINISNKDEDKNKLKIALENKINLLDIFEQLYKSNYLEILIYYPKFIDEIKSNYNCLLILLGLSSISNKGIKYILHSGFIIKIIEILLYNIDLLNKKEDYEFFFNVCKIFNFYENYEINKLKNITNTIMQNHLNENQNYKLLNLIFDILSENHEFNQNNENTYINKITTGKKYLNYLNKNNIKKLKDLFEENKSNNINIINLIEIQFIQLYKNKNDKEEEKLKNIIEFLDLIYYLSNNFCYQLDTFEKLYDILNIKDNKLQEIKEYDYELIIMDNDIPFILKSKLLYFLYNLILSFKINNKNEILKPKTNSNNNNDNYYPELHYELYTYLINLLITSINIIPLIDNNESRKDGIFIFSKSIIEGINVINNLLNNTNDIYYKYFLKYEKLVYCFLNNEKKFKKIFNININEKEEEKLIKSIKDKYDYDNELLKLIESNLIKYKFILNNDNTIYNKWINYCDGTLFPVNDNLFDFLNYENESLISNEDIDKYNKINTQKIYTNIYNNYNLFYQEKQRQLTNIDINSIIEALDLYTIGNEKIKNKFFEQKDPEEYINPNLINSFTLLFSSNSKYIRILENDKKEILINKILEKLLNLSNIEISISNSFCSTNYENSLAKYLLDLILLLKVITENYISDFHQYMFKTNKDQKVPFKELILIYKNIYNNLKNNDKVKKTKQKNLLVIFHALTYCILEYSEVQKIEYKKVIIDSYTELFTADFINELITQILNFDEIDGKIKECFMIYDIFNLLSKYLSLNEGNSIINEFHQKFHIDFGVYLSNAIIKIFNYTIEDKNISYADDPIKTLKFLKNRYLNRLVQKDPPLHLGILLYQILYINTNLYDYHICSTLFKGGFDDTEINNFINTFPFSFDIIKNIKLNISGLFRFLKQTSGHVEIYYDPDLLPEEIRRGSKGIVKFPFIIQRQLNYLSSDTKIYFIEHTDYTDRESKLIDLYDEIPTFVYETIYNSVYDVKFSMPTLFMYFINLLMATISIIYLFISYYKFPSDPHFQNNTNTSELRSKAHIIIVSINSAISVVFLVYYDYYNIKTNFFRSLHKDSLINGDKSKRLTLGQKSFLLRDLYQNLEKENNSDKKNKITVDNNNTFLRIFFDPELLKILDFFPDLKSLRKFFVYAFYTLIFDRRAFPFWFTLLCNLASLGFQFFLVMPIILWVFLSKKLTAIYVSIWDKREYLLLVFVEIYLILIIMSFLAFFAIPEVFRFSIADPENNILEEEEYQCFSTISCILYFLNYGFLSEGNLGLNLITISKSKYGKFVGNFLFNLIFYLLFDVIFGNIFLSLVIDSFTVVKETIERKVYNKENVCFICDINQIECIRKEINFDTHREEDHDLWKYVKFMENLMIKKETEYSFIEYYVWHLMKNKNMNWIPSNIN